MELIMAKHMQLCMVLMVALALVGCVVADQPLSSSAEPPKQTLPACPSTCGSVEIPYPFGIGYSSGPHQGPCYLDPRFELTCNKSVLYWSEIPVLHIDILQGQLDVSFYASSYCNSPVDNRPTLQTAWFSISSKENKFVTVGCDSYGYLNSVYNGDSYYSTGCLTRCYGNNIMRDDGSCSGIGCCQVDIPSRMWNISLQASNFPNSTYSGNCSYSFVVKNGSYTFLSSHLESFPYKVFPVVLDWTVGEANCNASESRSNYACKNNSYCDDKDDTDLGYRCRCKEGYEGNPYHPDGCIDIDECATPNHGCISKDNCKNTDGSHTCFCPKGQSGNGTKEEGCHRRDVLTKVVIGVAAAVVVLILMGTFSYLIYQKRKLIKLKEKFFRQNGGFILLQQLSTREDSSHTTQIFTEDQLKKATNNYDESLIIGRGGFGTVFKGFLANNSIVAIKKSKTIDASQIEQFINEVVILSQINHRNVVKLLGCCLETEVPLLVYEFVSNGTLSDFIHTKVKASNVTWKTRLRIAVEVAGALSYLHSDASMPIIHRDVKSANILLDDTYTAKVSDFGASKLVPRDQTDIATMVQGTLGYLDPEYMQTNQLTEKSDVYSFGVVLVELLTGEKPFSFDGAEERRSIAIAMHFLSCLKKDRMFDVLQVGILNEENKSEIKEVAILAAKCLRLKGEERPRMKEVVMKLEGIRSMEKHSWINTDQNLEETINTCFMKRQLEFSNLVITANMDILGTIA